MELQGRAAMSSICSMHGIQKADIVDMLSDIGKQLTDMNAAFTMLTKSPWRTKQIASRSKLNTWLGKRQRLPIILLAVQNGTGLNRPVQRQPFPASMTQKPAIQNRRLWIAESVDATVGMET
jgi:hypothetical protein